MYETRSSSGSSSSGSSATPLHRVMYQGRDQQQSAASQRACVRAGVWMSGWVGACVHQEMIHQDSKAEDSRAEQSSAVQCRAEQRRAGSDRL